MAKPRIRKAPRPLEPRALERAYASDLDDLVREMTATTRRFLARPLDRARRLDVAPEPFADLDWGALRIRLGRISDRAAAIVDKYARRIREFNTRDISRILTVDLRNEPPEVRAVLEAWRGENVSLISSIAPDLHTEVRAVVRASTQRGTRVETLAKAIEARYGVAGSRARLIARDQTLKANADLTRVRHSAAGITRYVWSTSRDERVREMHSDLEGTIHAWTDPPVTNPQGDRNAPGEDYQCRCVAVPVLDEDDPSSFGTP